MGPRRTPALVIAAAALAAGCAPSVSGVARSGTPGLFGGAYARSGGPAAAAGGPAARGHGSGAVLVAERGLIGRSGVGFAVEGRLIEMGSVPAAKDWVGIELQLGGAVAREAEAMLFARVELLFAGGRLRKPARRP